QPTRGEQVPLMVRQAWKTMVTGRPGPVVLDVPFDIFKEEAGETPDPREWSANISCRCGADPEGVAKAAEMLIAAERPAIIVGQGVRYGGATAELASRRAAANPGRRFGERAWRDRLQSSAVARPGVARWGLSGQLRDAAGRCAAGSRRA